MTTTVGIAQPMRVWREVADRLSRRGSGDYKAAGVLDITHRRETGVAVMVPMVAADELGA